MSTEGSKACIGLSQVAWSYKFNHYSKLYKHVQSVQAQMLQKGDMVMDVRRGF